MDIIINMACVDWLTLTTWSKARYEYWQREFTDFKQWLGEHDERYENYRGVGLQQETGKLFMGEGIQRAKQHYLLYLTSGLAELTYRQAVAELKRDDSHDFRASRIDLQVTIPEPPDYSAWDLLNALHSKGWLVTTEASRSKMFPIELRTIYVGSKGSDRLIRIYQKEDKHGDRFLRFECQYRNERSGGKAERLFMDILKQEEVKQQALLYEVQRLNSARLEGWFTSTILGHKKHVVKASYTKAMSTRRWLMQQVLPALDRYLMETNDMELVDIFYQVLNGER